MSILTLHSFARRRLEFGRLLASNKALTLSRYFRLMALAATEVLFTTPLSAYMMYLNATTTPISPWISWEDTHFDFSRVNLIPAIIWRNSSHSRVIAMELSRWASPICALLFFGFFGFAQEAKRNYRAGYQRLATVLGIPSKVTRPSGKIIIQASGNPPPVKLPLYSSPASQTTFGDDLKRPISSTSFSDTFNGSSTQPSTPNSSSLHSVETFGPSNYNPQNHSQPNSGNPPS
ncbi:hypothetical protein C0991_012355 [Blastosporella zonata]|nr:hypothetical protein C0991_012355 [Blastosporella zonata]